MGTLALLAFLAAPLLIYRMYGKIYDHAKKNVSHFQYLIWACVILFAIGDYLLSFIALGNHYIRWAHSEWKTQYRYFYWMIIPVWVLIAAIDLLIAIWIVLRKKIKDFPVPDLLLPRHVKKCLKHNTQIAQILAVWHTMAAFQILCFYAVFIFIAFIAQPLHTALVIIFYAACVFSFTTMLMLLLAATSTKLQEAWKVALLRFALTAVFISVVLFTGIFGYTFLRITIFVGDTESSRIPGLIGSLIPTTLIAVVGFLAKKLLDNYDKKSQQGTSECNGEQSCRSEEEGMNTSHPIEATLTNGLPLRMVFPGPRSESSQHLTAEDCLSSSVDSAHP